MSDKKPRFMVGEWVERRFDGAVGIVCTVLPYEGDFVYSADLQRTEDDVWSGTETAWVSYHRIHAHVEAESQDCDGRYLHSYTLDLLDRERQSAYGDHEFRERVLADIVDMTSEGEVRINPAGFHYGQATEEGYRSVVVGWCDEEDCSRGHLTRDLSAEKAGY